MPDTTRPTDPEALEEWAQDLLNKRGTELLAIAMDCKVGDAVIVTPEKIVNALACLLYAAGLAAHLGPLLDGDDNAWLAERIIQAARLAKSHAAEMKAAGDRVEGGNA